MKTGIQFSIQMFGAVLAALLMLASAPAVMAQEATATGDVIVVSPLSLVKSEDLDFGTLLAGASGGTAVVAPNGNRTTTGDVVAVGGTATASQFFGFGTPGRFVRIRSNAAVHTLTRSGGGETMDLRNLTLQANNLNLFVFGGSVFGQILPNGIITLNIGGTLDVGPDQEPGVYEGTFEIGVDYF